MCIAVSVYDASELVNWLLWCDCCCWAGADRRWIITLIHRRALMTYNHTLTSLTDRKQGSERWLMATARAQS